MHHRPVFTPRQQRLSGFPVETMIRNIDEARRCMNAELRLVLDQLPITIGGNYPGPDVIIEKSKRYIDSISLVTRDRKKFLGLVTYVQEVRVDLRVHVLCDFAHELAFFESKVVAGDAFEREATSGVSHGELVMRCNLGIYELESSVFDARARDGTATSSVRMGLFPFRELVAHLFAFGVEERGWRKRNNLTPH